MDYLARFPPSRTSCVLLTANDKAAACVVFLLAHLPRHRVVGLAGHSKELDYTGQRQDGLRGAGFCPKAREESSQEQRETSRLGFSNTERRDSERGTKRTGRGNKRLVEDVRGEQPASALDRLACISASTQGGQTRSDVTV